MKLTMLAVLALAGCFAYPPNVMGPRDIADSRVVVAGDPRTTAQQVTQLFASRGFPLTETAATADGVALIYGNSHRYWGARFYVRIEAWGPQESSVMMFGRPTFDGDDVCTGTDIGRPCRSSTYTSRNDNQQELIHGVLAELALNSNVVGPVPPTVPFVVVANR